MHKNHLSVYLYILCYVIHIQYEYDDEMFIAKFSALLCQTFENEVEIAVEKRPL